MKAVASKMLAGLGTFHRDELALRALRPPRAIPALRPIEPASRGTPLAAITDGLVEATDTLDSVLRTHLATRAP